MGYKRRASLAVLCRAKWFVTRIITTMQRDTQDHCNIDDQDLNAGPAVPAPEFGVIAVIQCLV